MDDDTLLIGLAKRTGDDPAYLAWLVRLMLEFGEQTWEELAAAWQFTPRQLAVLALCRRPSTATFAAETRQIAEHVQITPLELVRFIREGETLEEFRKPGIADIAARDYGNGDDNGGINSSR
jgi:hypothetical protein